MTKLPLQNCTIVVTRPTGQADGLNDMLRQAGATVVNFPVIEISPIADQQQLLEQAQRISEYDIVIFISRNAVLFGTPLLKSNSRSADNKIVQIAAIGSGTASQLQELGYTANIISGSTANTEGLLSEAAMQTVKGQRILIVRGRGGRGKLADTLRLRGAEVDYFECYQRSCPHNDPAILSRLWDKNSLHAIILTSAEGLKNLYQMVNECDLPRLNTTPLYVISSTMVELCANLGYKLTPIRMSSAHDSDVLESLTAHCDVAAN